MLYFELIDYVNKIKPYLIGKRINRLVSYSPNSFFFNIADGQFKQFSIIFDGEPRFYINNNEMRYKNVETVFYNLFKKEVPSATIEDMSVYEYNRVVSIRLLTTDKLFNKEIKHVILELNPSKRNIIITDKNNIILAAMHATTLDCNRPVTVGFEYVPPERLPIKDGTSANNHLEDYLSKYILMEKEFDQKKKNVDFSYHIKSLKSKKNILASKIKKLMIDMDYASDFDDYFAFGNYILTNIDSIKEGDEILNIDDVQILLDTNIIPSKNAERYFKKGKKLKSALVHIKEEIARAKDELSYVEKEIDEFEKCDYRQMEEKIGSRPKEAKGHVHVFSDLPYFVEVGGTKILFGKNARQNDKLTFSLDTSRDHLFIHVIGTSGSHVIIKKANPTDKEINIACELAILLSKKEDGQVSVSLRKDVRKGNSPGQVVLKNHRVIKIKRISEESKNILKTQKRYLG